MSFITREANIDDAEELFKLTKKFHENSFLREEPFTTDLNNFISSCFSKKPKAHYFIAEFQGKMLGYSTYSLSYSVLEGASIVITELYVREDYRKLGVSTFLYSKIFDVAFKNKTNLIKWHVSLTSKKHIDIEKKMGVAIDMDNLVLNIQRKNIKKFLENNSHNTEYNVHKAKTFELPEIFDCVKLYAKEKNIDIQTDVYKLMSAAFSSNPKIRFIVAKKDEEVIGFLSFFDAYYSSSDKILIADIIIVQKKMRGKNVGYSLLKYLAKYVYENNYAKAETVISKYNIEKIERLKEFGMFPYDNVRIASYQREEFEKFFEN